MVVTSFVYHKQQRCPSFSISLLLRVTVTLFSSPSVVHS